MSLSVTEKNPVPWYKQGWPWFLIALPGTAIIAGVITLVIAINSWDGLVVDDYYKEGKAFVQTIERTERARTLGLKARLQIRTDSIRIELSSAVNAAAVPATIHLTVSHPTRGGLDQQIRLSGRDGVFEGAMAPLSTGRWLFQIEDEPREWRMNGAAFLPTETEIRIDPSGT
ncbi:nitrogen fixation protein FixH [Azoarcus sp. DD4]|uniref:FixH family protein n=1 Tax=Azoarcus sp. DD4 TaxID=2027405 RepID=UPI0011276B67|nr:FixH family protein [Azoarcus sp. DD4]QDF96558.1 nitrogen fixation protein FixH [Azoarcus sp. DD4]